MAINQNHLFDELDGVKCAVVEKNVVPSRVAFLRGLLEGNGFTVVVVPSPPPKAAAGGSPTPAAAPVPSIAASPLPAAAPSIAAAPSPAPSPSAPPLTPAPPPSPETFTVGVTDVTFNATNAIFGRLLRTKDGHVVTLAYWQQKEAVSNDEVPYFEGPEALT